MDMDLALLLLLDHGLDALRLIFRLILLKQRRISFSSTNIELGCFSTRYVDS